MIGLEDIQLCGLLSLCEAVNTVWIGVQGLEGTNTLQEGHQGRIGRVGCDWESVGVGDNIASRQGREHAIAGRAGRDILREQGR